MCIYIYYIYILYIYIVCIYNIYTYIHTYMYIYEEISGPGGCLSAMLRAQSSESSSAGCSRQRPSAAQSRTFGLGGPDKPLPPTQTPGYTI